MILRNAMVPALGLAVVIGLGGLYPTAYAQGQQNAGKVTIERNKAAVRRWIDEGFNKRNVKAVDELFAADFAVNGQKVGREGLKQSMSRFLSAFPDLHVTIDEIVAEGNKVGIWYTVQGTHHGDFTGANARVANMPKGAAEQ